MGVGETARLWVFEKLLLEEDQGEIPCLYDEFDRPLDPECDLGGGVKVRLYNTMFATKKRGKE